MTTQGRRLAAGGRIDRDRALRFTFNGKAYQGRAGDTLASALLANGVHRIGRSFKYHRPRGILSAGPEEPNALVQLGSGATTSPNEPATTLGLVEGMTANSQNCWPSVGFDLGGINDRLSRLMPAGFYYKTFMWPRRFWLAYEYFIRRAAGLGRAPRTADPERYDHTHAHCDVLVVGGGAAGLAAALAAGQSGARVILAEQDNEFGGALLAEPENSQSSIDGRSPREWLDEMRAALTACPEVRVLNRTTVFGYYEQNFIGMLETLPAGTPVAQRLWKVRAKQVVLATGALERLLAFNGNDRPGIMLAGSVRTYLNRYAVAPGRRAVIFTNNDSAYAAALDLHTAGVQVPVIIDLRSRVNGIWPERASAAGIEILANHAVVATRGRQHVRSVEVMAMGADGATVTGQPRTIHCDLVGMSGGWNPTVHLFSQSRGGLRFKEDQAAFVPGNPVQSVRCAGACNGSFTRADALREGPDAGQAAAAAAGFTESVARDHCHVDEPEAPGAMRHLWRIPTHRPTGKRKCFIDLHNDVTIDDLALGLREGYRSIEHIKRYTTAGMGTDQGKTGNITALGVVSELAGSDIPAIGTTTFRPPYTPVTFGAVAGRNRGPLFDPIRKTSLHAWHEAHGAVFENVGQWQRPHYYPRANESMHVAVQREVRAARQTAGLLDASTLGKIDIQGRDAIELLNRVYAGSWNKLAVGQCRYGVMLGEDGMVMDDGVTTRLGERHYLMSTTTGNAASVFAWLEEWLQTEWTDLHVYVTSVTEQWATISLCGEASGRILAGLTDIELDSTAFPPMTLRHGFVAGCAARVMRISFSGGPGYEINVAAPQASVVWEACMQAGAGYGITPYGTEAMHVLRAEKGFILVGQDTDGTLTPHDLGMSWAIGRNKPDFLGKRSLTRSDTQRAGRKQLVGLLTDDPRDVIPTGAQLVAEVEAAPPMTMLGHVTSSYYSPHAGRAIALAVIKGGHGRIGQRLYAPLVDRTCAVTVTEPRFFDPAREVSHAG